MNPTARKTLATVCTLVAVVLVTAAPALALAPKEVRDQLDLLVTIDPSLRVVEANVDATGFNGVLAGAESEHQDEDSLRVPLSHGLRSHYRAPDAHQTFTLMPSRPVGIPVAVTWLMLLLSSEPGVRMRCGTPGSTACSTGVGNTGKPVRR